MKRNTNNRIRLGVFVTVGVALFIIGIYFIGSRQHLFSDNFRISGIFKDVSGLQIGNNVRFAGINVGTISDIEITTDTTVRVDMIIDRASQKFIKKDARAIIGSEGLMGNKVLVIMPGSSEQEPISDNDIIETSMPVSFDDILANLKVTTDNASIITDDLATIMSGIRSGRGTVGKLFMDSSFARNVDQTIVNLKKSSKGLDENMEAAKHNILLKGYFNKKEKEAQRKEREAQKAKEGQKTQQSPEPNTEKKGIFNGRFKKKDKEEEEADTKK
ncbi:MAG: MlaD family protein [Bacteroidia bacterium]|jgi:phospholipid/cholesterol/gamma-HCH transport system substrate-binding protein